MQSKDPNDFDGILNLNQDNLNSSENFDNIDENKEVIPNSKIKLPLKTENTNKNRFKTIIDHDSNQKTEPNENIICTGILFTAVSDRCLRPVQNSESEENPIIPHSSEPLELILSPEILSNNIKTFYNYYLKSLLVFMIYLIVIKYLQILFKRYCFGRDGCDCSDNNLIIKIWSMILVQHCLGHILWVLYLCSPEFNKSLLKYQLI